MRRARALTNKVNNDRAEQLYVDLTMFPYFSFQKQILLTIIYTLSKNEQNFNVGS